MTLINTTTLQIVSFAELQQMYPLVSFPADISVLSIADLANFGVAPLTYTTQPSSQYYSVSMGAPVANGDGTYSTTWVQTPIDVTQAQSMLMDTISTYTQNIAWADITYNGATLPTNATCGVIMAHIAAGTASIVFKGDNGVFVTIAPSDAVAIQTQMANQLGLAFQVEQQLATQVANLNSVDAVAAYDVVTQWNAAQTAILSAA